MIKKIFVLAVAAFVFMATCFAGSIQIEQIQIEHNPYMFRYLGTDSFGAHNWSTAYGFPCTQYESWFYVDALKFQVVSIQYSIDYEMLNTAGMNADIDDEGFLIDDERWLLATETQCYNFGPWRDK